MTVQVCPARSEHGTCTGAHEDDDGDFPAAMAQTWIQEALLQPTLDAWATGTPVQLPLPSEGGPWEWADDTTYVHLGPLMVNRGRLFRSVALTRPVRRVGAKPVPVAPQGAVSSWPAGARAVDPPITLTFPRTQGGGRHGESDV